MVNLSMASLKVEGSSGAAAVVSAAGFMISQFAFPSFRTIRFTLGPSSIMELISY